MTDALDLDPEFADYYDDGPMGAPGSVRTPPAGPPVPLQPPRAPADLDSPFLGLFPADGLVADALRSATGADIGAAAYTREGELVRPEGFREWVFIGAPLTPHGLNGGKAGFPEYHHVYVNPDAYAVYRRTGTFPDGTVIAKELVLLKPGTHADGSLDAPSGRGYFGDRFHGMDVMVKDSRRYGETQGWAFFNNAHSQYLQLACEGGLLLAVPAIAALVFFARLALSSVRADKGETFWVRIGAAAGLFGLAVQGIWEVPLVMPANAILAGALAGLLTYRRDRHHHDADRRT